MEMADNIFLLRSGLTNTRGLDVDHCSFERLLNVRFLREAGRHAAVYDEELKMYFVDKRALSHVYEIETADFTAATSQRLVKAQEYIRRINYRYDWMQVKINNEGRILDIPNREELRERWPKLKAAISMDYEGDVVAWGLSEIDRQFDAPKGIDACLSQYFHFGLLLPCVPRNHGDNWERLREVGFSDYENEMFEERISHVQTGGDGRHYELVGTTFPDSHTKINCYKGNLYLFENEVFPEYASVEVEFERDNIINRWSFELLRYNQDRKWENLHQ